MGSKYTPPQKKKEKKKEGWGEDERLIEGLKGTVLSFLFVFVSFFLPYV
jgi:hypothetical protein